MPGMEMPNIGDRFLDRYELVALLGKGGFAYVYQGEDVKSGRQVALKVLNPGRDGYDEGKESRFDREVKVLSRLRDPHTITMYDFGRSPEGLLYMVFEYIEGEDLSELLHAHGPMPESEVVHILDQVLQSLREAHAEGLLHRDIKPANIRIFEYMGDARQAKLLDFGIAKPAEAGEGAITQDGIVIGTPQFMSAEQLYGRPLTPATDIFALGLVAYEMLSGQRAITDPAPMELAKRLADDIELPPGAYVSPGMREIVEKMLKKRPAHRFGSADAVISALRGHDPQQAAHGTSAAAQNSAPAAPLPARQPARTAAPPPAVGDDDEPPTEPTVKVGGPAPPTDEKAATTASERHPDDAAASTRVMLTNVAITAVGVLGGMGVVILLLTLLSGDDPPPPPPELPPAEQAPVEPAPPQGEGKPPVKQGLAVPPPDAGAAAAADSPACRSTDIAPGLHSMSRTVGGEKRNWVVYVPRKYDAAKDHPAIVMVHQAVKNPQIFIDETGAKRIADDYGIVLIATHHGGFPKITESDLQLPVEAVRQTSESVCIDPLRMFGLGDGTGGRVIEVLPCRMPLAAIATSAFRGTGDESMCEWHRDIPYLHVVGKRDPHNPLEGGKSCAQMDRISLKAKEKIWRDRLGCQGEATEVDVAPGFECRTWDCRAEFRVCLLDGGHAWPDSSPPPTEIVFKACASDPPQLPMLREIWNFFDAHAPPAERKAAEKSE